MTTKEEATERRLEALRLRKSGVSVADIAVRIGCSLRTAYEYIEAGRKEYFEQFPEEKLQIRSMDLARLDDMQAAIYEQACSGDMKAIYAALKIMERRARMLYSNRLKKIQAGQCMISQSISS